MPDQLSYNSLAIEEATYIYDNYQVVDNKIIDLKDKNEILDIPIENLGFSTRSFNALMRSKYVYRKDYRDQSSVMVSEILSIPYEKYTKMKNLGEKSIFEIIHKLRLYLDNGVDDRYITYNKGQVINDSLSLPFFERYDICKDLIADCNISEIDSFSVRTINSLNGNGIFKLSELLLVSEKEIIKFRNLGAKCLYEINSYFLSFSDWEIGLNGYKKSIGNNWEDFYSKLETALNNIPSNRFDLSIKYLLIVYKNGKGLEFCESISEDNIENLNLRQFFDEYIEKKEIDNNYLRFAEWCNFDINADAVDLLGNLCDERSRKVLLMRSENKTLEEVGNNFLVTRERIRQIESKAFRKFRTIEHNYRLLWKIFAENNGATVLPLFELKKYILDEVDRKIVEYLYRKNSINGIVYFDEKEVFLFTSDEAIKQTKKMISSLPDILTKREFNSGAYKFSKEQNVPIEIVKLVAGSRYNYNRRNYFDKKCSQNLMTTSVIAKYFPDGIRIYNDEDLDRFREAMKLEYGNVKLPSSVQLSRRIQSLTTMCDRGTYAVIDDLVLPHWLEKSISKTIEQSKSNAIYINGLYLSYENNLKNCGIDNAYYFHSILQDYFGDKYTFSRDYIIKVRSETHYFNDNAADYIRKLIKNSQYPVTKEEIKKHIPNISDIMISFAVKDPSIVNLFGKYISIDNLQIAPFEKNVFERLIDNEISKNGFVHIKDLYEQVLLYDSGLLSKMYINYSFGFFSLLNCLFQDKYQFSRPFISKIGLTIDSPMEKVTDIVQNADRINVFELYNYAVENRMTIYSMLDFFNSFNDSHLLVSHDHLEKIERIGVNEKIVDECERIILEDLTECKAISELSCVNKFPQIEHKWTEWLIYSALKKWGTKLDVAVNNNKYKEAVPLIGRKDQISESDIRKFASYRPAKLQLADDLDDIDFLITDYLIEELEF